MAKNAMLANERTRDLYEQLDVYPKPPLIPLPALDDLESLTDLGLIPGKTSHPLIKAALLIAGFRRFQKQLPQNIESLLRQCNLRGPGLFAPLISATLALADDPRTTNPIERATTLILAVRMFYEDFFSGTFEPDRYGGQVLEMGQYPNLFATSVIFEGKQARIFKSKKLSQINVIVGRHFFLLDLEMLETDSAFEQITTALSAIVEFAQKNRCSAEEPSPGWLTACSGPTQIRTFQILQQHPVNRKSLYALRHGLFTLCLDLETVPKSLAEATFLAHSTNFGNRWFHSSLQVVVFGNAQTCAICSFDAYLDGNVMMRGAAEIRKRAAACPIKNNASSDFSILPPAIELQ